MNNNNIFKTRHKARRYTLQALYSWFVSNNDLKDIEEYLLKGKNLSKIDVEYFRELLYKIPLNLKDLQELIKPHLSRKLEEITIIELTILYIAAYELKYKKDVPYKVVINEAIELTKIFGATDSHKFVNGVIDKVAQELRVEE